MSQILDVVVELALLAATVRSVPNLVYVISTETMSLRPRPPSSTRIEVSMFVPSRAKVTKRIVGDNANAGIDGEAVAGVVVAGASVLGAVSVSGADSSSNPSVAGVASGLAGAPVEGVAVDGAGDSTSVVTVEVVSGDSTLSADSD